jgi:hypothetical protein
MKLFGHINLQRNQFPDMGPCKQPKTAPRHLLVLKMVRDALKD